MNAPTRKAPGQLGSTTGRKLLTLIAYSTLSLFANVFRAIARRKVSAT
jgi:hypothetical protein